MIRTPSKVVMVSSSPGRAEKLPAPMLTTLLRGKGGSRSRGRSSVSISRSSPMFTARRRGASVDIQEEKEPSSPKVTCIGQVRISNKRKSSASGSSSSPLRSKQEQQKQGGCVPRGCRCFRRGFFCNPFSKGFGVKFKPSSASASPYRHHYPRGWRKWFLLPRSGCYRQRNPPRQRQQHQQWQKEETPRMPTGAQAVVAGSDDEGEHGEHGEVEEDDDEEETKVFVPATPPKNALLLMRCRSAPHRAACVPDRPFWSASPCGAESDSAASAAAAPGGMEPSRGGENRGEAEPNNDYSTVSTYEARARGINDGGAGESGEGEDDDGEAAAVGPSPSFSSRRLILTRCKSEPARTAAKLAAPDASYCFWNSGINQSNKPRSKNSSSSNNNSKRWLTLLGEARPIPSLRSDPPP